MSEAKKPKKKPTLPGSGGDVMVPIGIITAKMTLNTRHIPRSYRNQIETRAGRLLFTVDRDGFAFCLFLDADKARSVLSGDAKKRLADNGEWNHLTIGTFVDELCPIVT